jgi:hypothetical protein
MVGSSILPACFYNGKLYFLFGKENALADTPGWSDFGGGVEPGENELETAVREGGEELTGFLGGPVELRKLTKHFHIVRMPTYVVHIIHLPYDTHQMLPEYYNNNHRFLWERMDKKMLNDTKLFEKIEVGWFTVEDMIRRRSEFRGFYQEIVDNILADKTAIRAFLRKCMKGHRATRKNVSKRSFG